MFSVVYSPKAVYIWLLNFAGMPEFIVWLSIAVSHYRFRQGYVKQGYDTADLPYKAGLFPFGPLLAFVLCLLVTLGQNYQAFQEQRIDWIGVISTYLAIPLFLAFWIGHRLLRKSRWIPYADMRYYGVDANGAPPPARVPDARGRMTRRPSLPGATAATRRPAAALPPARRARRARPAAGQPGTDRHQIGMPAHHPGLLRRAHAETRTTGKPVCARAPCQRLGDAVLRQLGPGRAGQHDVIDEAARVAQRVGQPGVLGGRRRHADQVHPVLAQLAVDLARVFQRQVDQDQPVHARLARIGRRPRRHGAGWD